MDYFENSPKRWGKAIEVCNLICFLLSEKSSYITGSEYNIDGGWLLNEIKNWTNSYKIRFYKVPSKALLQLAISL